MKAHNISADRALESLRYQLFEGVDECIELLPTNRFLIASSQAAQKAEHDRAPIAPVAPKTRNTSEQASIADKKSEPQGDAFQDCKSEREILERLEAILPAALIDSAQSCLPGLGDGAAEIALIIDPPGGDADRAGDLLADEGSKLLLRSLEHIDIALDAESGVEPKARLRFLPISPWRIPQDRKFTPNEGKIFLAAMEAMIGVGGYRAVLLAGARLEALEREIIDGSLWNIPATLLIPPRQMLREPLLKRNHWQTLVKFHHSLDKLMAL